MKSTVSDHERGITLTSQLHTALEAVRTNPTDKATLLDYLKTRGELASWLLDFPRSTKPESLLKALDKVVREQLNSAAQELSLLLPFQDEALLKRCQKAGWTGLLAGFLLSPVWRWTEVPALDEVPTEFWSLHTAWCFTAPHGLPNAGELEAYAKALLRHTNVLATWVERNRGSAAVQAAVQQYLACKASLSPLAPFPGNLRELARARAHILQRGASGAARSNVEPPPALPRGSRALRIAFLENDFTSGTAPRALLPYFEKLDPSNFEVILLAAKDSVSPLLDYCRSLAREYHVLPSDWEEACGFLEALNLDVLVFGGDLTGPWDEATRVATRRFAPLQVATCQTPTTSGLPTIDLYVSDEYAEGPKAGGDYLERLALLPGTAHCFNYDQAREPASQTWTRESLGIASDSVVFVAASQPAKITAELRALWLGLLAGLPNSHLILHAPAETPGAEMETVLLCKAFDGDMEKLGISPDRVIISTLAELNRGDIGNLLSVGNLFLDTPGSSSVEFLPLALKSFIPVLTCEGACSRARAGAALLHGLKLPELIAPDTASYAETARRLASDPAAREALSKSIKDVMERLPLFFDSLASSDTFGDLVLTAYDSLSETTPEAFRKDPLPLKASRNSPLDAEGRRGFGNFLRQQGFTSRAVDYLMAAVSQDEGSAALWLDVCRALYADGKPQEAIQSLEYALRMDNQLEEGWLLLIEIAGPLMPDLAAEAREILAGITASKQAPAPAKSNVDNIVGKLRSFRRSAGSSS